MSVLADIRVLDFGRYIAGPYLATHLGDLGADVIRLEKVDGSEDRFVGPVGADGAGALFLQAARNKRGMTLNPTKPEGKKVLARLVATADVVVANMPASGLAAMGIDLESLRAHKPDIILATNNVFGAGGPWSDRVGFDGLAQAMSGAVAMSGPPGQPTRSIAPFADFCSATLGAMAVLAALRHRDQTGEGQQVETALLKTALMMTNSLIIEQSLLGIDRESTHNRGQTAAPSDVFFCSDGQVAASVLGAPLWERWCNIVGRPDLLNDDRFKDDISRGDHRDELCGLMNDWCADRTVTEVLDTLADARVPAAPVYTPQQALDDEHVNAISFLEPTDYPGGLPAPAPLAGFPVDMSAIDTSIRTPAPTLGQHTDEILTELGYSADEIVALRTSRTI
ncbi:MAG: crotonobetainyl-CoA:carnitine CoA-transferase CaiB-like acyl-CoA transferase [Candidatus Poriferisodalaceae bacterium]|jgi:crotonobetainyl-CoA:carnitine CoA-transferase CaiB-like acyl-CoA transferase